jgi:hypothetical protein
MTRENNIYGKLVNNKFSDLLTANMNTTWLQMHVVLDREMPQDKEKRRGLWVSWKSTGTVIAIVMLASAISYYSYQKRTSISTDNNVHGSKTVKEIKLVPAPLNPLNKKSIFSTEPAEQEFPTANASPGTGVLTTQAILSNDDDANRKGLPQRGFHNLNVPEVNNKIEAKKLSNNYTGEGFNSHGMVIEKRYSLSAMPVIEHLSTEKLLSKGDLIIPGHLSFHPLNDKKSSVFQKKTGWVLGAAIHYNAPMSNQEMSTININGKKNTLVDFIPSVFAQYHLNNKWYVETGFQFSSPQYTPDLKLFSSCVDVAVGKRKESAVWLNKLYYMSVPLSVHFKPFNRFSVGAGIQYSFLKRSLLMDEHAGWQEDNNGQWQKTYSTVIVKSQKIKSKGNSNSNNTSPATGMETVTETVMAMAAGMEMGMETVMVMVMAAGMETVTVMVLVGELLLVQPRPPATG